MAGKNGGKIIANLIFYNNIYMLCASRFSDSVSIIFG